MIRCRLAQQVLETGDIESLAVRHLTHERIELLRTHFPIEDDPGKQTGEHRPGYRIGRPGDTFVVQSFFSVAHEVPNLRQHINSF